MPIKTIILMGTKSGETAEAINNRLGDRGVEAEAHSDIEPDYNSVLTEYDNLGYDVALIFDAAMKSKTEGEQSILYFLSHPRRKGNHLRIVFVASKQREIKDPFITRLINVGVFDIAIPRALDDDQGKALAAAMEMIVAPRNFSQVRQYKMTGVPDLEFDPIKSKDIKKADAILRTTAPQEVLKDSLEIGVIGASRFSGTTTIAQAIARSLVLAKMKTALLFSDENDFIAVRDMHRNPVLVNPKRINLAGLDIYHGNSASDIDEDEEYAAVVIDFKTAYTKDDVPRQIKETVEYATARDNTRSWSRCACSVLCSGTAIQKLNHLLEVLSDISEAKISKLNVALNLTSAEMEKMIADHIHLQAPECNVFSVHETSDALALTEVPYFVKDIIKFRFGVDLKRTV